MGDIREIYGRYRGGAVVRLPVRVRVRVGVGVGVRVRVRVRVGAVVRLPAPSSGGRQG